MISRSTTSLQDARLVKGYKSMEEPEGGITMPVDDGWKTFWARLRRAKDESRKDIKGLQVQQCVNMNGKNE